MTENGRGIVDPGPKVNMSQDFTTLIEALKAAGTADFSAGPVPNCAVSGLPDGQWNKASEGPFQVGLDLVSNADFPLIQLTGRFCRTLPVKDSHQELLRLDGRHERGQARPLPHDELVDLQRRAQEARIAADPAGQGDGLARMRVARGVRRSSRRRLSSSACP